MIILSLLFILLSILCYAIVQTLQLRYSKSIFANTKLFSFFNLSSWIRKYKRSGKLGIFEKAPDNWYYRLFKIEYKERFPGSATIFVFVTDAMHLFQFLFFNFLTLGIILLLPLKGIEFLYNFVALRLMIWVVWGLFFEYIFIKHND